MQRRLSERYICNWLRLKNGVCVQISHQTSQCFHSLFATYLHFHSLLVFHYPRWRGVASIFIECYVEGSKLGFRLRLLWLIVHELGNRLLTQMTRICKSTLSFPILQWKRKDWTFVYMMSVLNRFQLTWIRVLIWACLYITLKKVKSCTWRRTRWTSRWYVVNILGWMCSYVYKDWNTPHDEAVLLTPKVWDKKEDTAPTKDELDRYQKWGFAAPVFYLLV